MTVFCNMVLKSRYFFYVPFLYCNFTHMHLIKSEAYLRPAGQTIDESALYVLDLPLRQDASEEGFSTMMRSTRRRDIIYSCMNINKMYTVSNWSSKQSNESKDGCHCLLGGDSSCFLDWGPIGKPLDRMSAKPYPQVFQFLQEKRGSGGYAPKNLLSSRSRN